MTSITLSRAGSAIGEVLWPTLLARPQRAAGHAMARSIEVREMIGCRASLERVELTRGSRDSRNAELPGYPWLQHVTDDAKPVRKLENPLGRAPALRRQVPPDKRRADEPAPQPGA